MRIAHLNDIAHVASVLAAGQRAAGHDAAVFDPGKPGARLPYPWKLISAPARVGPIATAAWRIRRGRFDVVHVHYATHAPIGLLCGAPTVVHCHGSDIRGVRPASLVGRYLRAALDRAGAVLYATPDLADWAAGLRADASFLPNPIDTQAFRPTLAAERDVLLGVRLSPVKGADVAIEGLRELVRRRPGTTVTIIGDGPLLEKARLAIGARAIVVPPLPHGRMPALLARHRVTLGQFRLGILSQYELEAMAVGLPLVADFRFPGVYDAPPPVVDAASPEAVALALARLLDDEPERRAVSVEGRAWVAANHGVDRVVARLAATYAAAGAGPR